MKRWKKLRVLLTAAVFLLSFLFTACGKISVDEKESPELKSAEIISYNNGSEQEQFVEVKLEFDGEIAVADKQKDTLRITVAGNRIKKEEYTLKTGEDSHTAVVTIAVEAVTNGILKIQKSEESDVISDITDKEKKYAVKEFTLEGLIPSGVSMSTVQTQEGLVVKQVDTVWNIRSIAWVALTENGMLLPVAETDGAEMLDGYAAVHGHEFLWENESMIADSIVEILEKNYGAEYSFSCDGSQITVEKPGEDVELDIGIYQYLKINGEPVKS